MLDIMSDGRFILGAAIGYRPDDFDLFHVALRNRGARLEEQVKLLHLLWSEDNVDFNGRFFQLSGATVEPKPLTPGGPPIWLGCWGDLSLRRAATLCDAWLPAGTPDLPNLLECQAKYRSFLREAGKDLAAVPTPLPRSMVIAETREKAIEMAEPIRLHYRDEYGGAWQHPLIGALDPSRFNDVLDIGRDRFIIGNPEDCIREIRRYQEQFGVDHLMCVVGSAETPHEFVMNSLRLIANEVMPAFA